jgi:hypothetical protein
LSSQGGNFYVGTSTDALSATSTYLTITKTGNVGIGTTSPLSKLAISGGASIGADYNIAAPSNGLIIQGNVGIGTTTPRSLLNVAGAKPQLTLTDTSAGLNDKHWFLSSQGGNFYVGTSTDALSATSTYLTITKTGNVGIGTTSPTEMLSVAGRMYISGTGTSTIQNNLYVKGTLRATKSYTGDLIFANMFRFTESASTSLVQELYLQTPTGENALAVDEFGNVRIGDNEILKQVQDDSGGQNDSGGAYKLAVGGDVAATGFVNISTREAKTDIQYLNDADYSDALQKILGSKVARYEYTKGLSPYERDLVPSSSKRLGLIAEEAPPEVLSANGKGVDLYKMTSLAWAGMKALSSSASRQQKEIDALKMDVDELKNKIAGLQISPFDSAQGKIFNFSFASILDAFRGFGAIFENGVAKFQQVVVGSLAVEKNSDSTQSAVGEGIITAGATEYQINSSQIKADSKIFVTWRGDYGSRWWIDQQADGSAVVKIAAPLANDVRFDWMVIGIAEPRGTNGEPQNNAELNQGNQEAVPAPVLTPEPTINASSAPEVIPPADETASTTSVFEPVAPSTPETAQ